MDALDFLNRFVQNYRRREKRVAGQSVIFADILVYFCAFPGLSLPDFPEYMPDVSIKMMRETVRVCIYSWLNVRRMIICSWMSCSRPTSFHHTEQLPASAATVARSRRQHCEPVGGKNLAAGEKARPQTQLAQAAAFCTRDHMHVQPTLHN